MPILLTLLINNYRILSIENKRFKSQMIITFIHIVSKKTTLTSPSMEISVFLLIELARFLNLQDKNTIK
jgi:hypothetical protein